jgi:hypothetical protein
MKFGGDCSELPDEVVEEDKWEDIGSVGFVGFVAGEALGLRAGVGRGKAVTVCSKWWLLESSVNTALMETFLVHTVKLLAVMAAEVM